MIPATRKARIRPVHPFPARMASAIAEEHLLDLDKGATVLDPMAGSGTTLILARLRGLAGIGVDTDPLSRLLAECWSSRVDEPKARRAMKRILEGCSAQWQVSTRLPFYPLSADAETRDFIAYWFDESTQRELTALSMRIGRVRDPAVRRVMWTAFSRLIIVKEGGVSLGKDIAHSRPHRTYDSAPRSALASFGEEVETVVDRISAIQGAFSGPAPRVLNADARRLPLESASVDAVITSPPYLNAIDYMRAHKFSLVWMGYTVAQLRSIRAESIGTEVSWKGPLTTAVQEALRQAGGASLPNRERGMLARYLVDMNLALSEIRRVLRDGKQAALVVGDSRIRGFPVLNSEAVVHLARENGLNLVHGKERPLLMSRRYLPPPEVANSGAQLTARMRSEWVLRFKAI